MEFSGEFWSDVEVLHGAHTRRVRLAGGRIEFADIESGSGW